MATPTLIATSMSATANTYCTLVEANAYFDQAVYRSAWQGSYADEQNRALLTATRLLDEQFLWTGNKYTLAQSLRWPRSGVVDADGFDIDYLTIPQFLKNATAELAGYMIASDRTVEDDTRGFKEMQAGSLRLVIDKADRKKVIPDSVMQILAPYGSIKSATSTSLKRV